MKISFPMWIVSIPFVKLTFTCQCFILNVKYTIQTHDFIVESLEKLISFINYIICDSVQFRTSFIYEITGNFCKCCCHCCCHCCWFCWSCCCCFYCYHYCKLGVKKILLIGSMWRYKHEHKILGILDEVFTFYKCIGGNF